MCDKFGFYSSGQSRVGETREIPKIADFRFIENAIRRIHPDSASLCVTSIREQSVPTSDPRAQESRRAVGEAVRSRSRQRTRHENEITAFPIRRVIRPSR